MIIVNVWLMVTAVRGRGAALPEKPRDGHELALVGSLYRYSTSRAVWMTVFGKVSALTPEAAANFIEALSVIAKGRTDNGRPLAAEVARQTARHALLARGWDWNSRCISTCRDCAEQFSPDDVVHDDHGFAVCNSCMAKRKVA